MCVCVYVCVCVRARARAREAHYDLRLVRVSNTRTQIWTREGEGFYVWVSVHHKLIYIKRTNVIQLGSVFICNCNIALHVSDAFCVHLQECLETVVAASGE